MDSYLNITIRVSAAAAVAAIGSVRTQLNSLQATAAASGAGGFGASISKGLSGIGTAVSAAVTSLKGLASTLKETGYQFTAAFTVPLVLAGKALFSYVLDNQTQIANLKKVYGDLTMPISQVNSEVSALEKNFEVLSEMFGVNISDVTQIAAAWAQAGVTGVALATSVHTTLQAMVIGDLSATDATTALIAIQAQYHASSSDLVNILNDLNVVENQTALNTSDLVTGFSRAAGAAADSGVDYQHLAALLAALVPAAGSAGAAGNALKTIFSRLLAPTQAASDALKDMGINTDGLNWTNLTAVQRIEALSTRFESLTGQEKANAAATIASRFQINRFDILMQDVANHLYNVANGLSDQTGRLSYYGIALDSTTNAQQNAKVAANELNIALSNPQTQLKQVGVLLKNTFGDILVTMMPTVLAFAGYLAQFAHWFADLSPLTQKWVFYLLAILAAIGPISFLLGAVIKLFLTFGGVLSGLIKLGAGIVGFFAKIIGGLFSLLFTQTGVGAASVADAAATQAGLVTVTVAGMAAMTEATSAGYIATTTVQTVANGALITETITTWGAVETATAIGMAAVVETVDTGMALVETAPATAFPVLIITLVALAVLIATAVGIAIYKFRDQIGSFFVDIGDGIWAAMKNIASALAQLPGIFVSVFNAVVRVVSEAVQQVYKLFSYLDPFAHHSPSLVENVTNGMAAVNAQFATLENVAGPVNFAYGVLSKFGSQIAAIVQETNALGQQSDIAALMKVDPGLVPIYEALASQINVLTPLAVNLNNAIIQQTAVVNADKAALDALTAQQTIYANQMTADQTAISTYANTQITGQQAMSDAIFNNTQAQKALQLQMMQMQDAVGPIADVQNQLSSLNGTILELQGTQENLRQGGAGSDILNSFDSQIQGAQSQVSSLQATASAYQALSDQLTALQNQGQELDLEQSLDFDGLTREIQQAANAMTELPFDQIMAGIRENQAALATATDQYNAQTVAVNAATAEYNAQNDALTGLTNSYNQVNDAINSINNALQQMNSLQSAKSQAASAAGAAAGGAGAGGDFPNADLGSNLSAGNVPGDNTDAINDITKQLADQLQQATDKLDLTAPIRKALDKVKGYWDHFWTMIGNGLYTFFVRWPVDAAKGVAGLAEAIYRGVTNLASDVWNWVYKVGSNIIGGIVGGIEDAYDSVLNFFKKLPGDVLNALEAFPGMLANFFSTLMYNAGYIIGYTLGLIVKEFIAFPGQVLHEFEALPGQLETVGKAIMNGLWDGIKAIWTGITYFFTTILPTIDRYFSDAITWLVNAGADIAEGLFNGVTDGLSALKTFFSNLPGWTLTAIESTGKALMWLVNIGGDIVQGLINGLADAAQGVWNWITSFVSGFIKGFKDAMGIKSPSTIFYSIGNDIIQGLLNGLYFLWTTVTGWLGSLGTKVIASIVGAVTWLYNIGSDAITGFWNGLKWEWNMSVSFLTNLGQIVLNAIGNIGNILYNIGSAIITSLWNGMKAVWNDTKKWLGGLANDITNLKGPIEVDRQLLVPHGNAIMQGLHQGLTEGFQPIMKDLSAMGNQIAGALSPSMNVKFNAGLSSKQIENAITNKIGTTATTGTAPVSMTFTGDLSFPNITDPTDADAFIKNLQVLANSGS